MRSRWRCSSPTWRRSSAASRACPISTRCRRRWPPISPRRTCRPTIVMAPHPELQAIPWATRPLLRLREGRAEASDMVSLQHAFAGIAETGTLMLPSAPQRPTTLNLLADTEIVLLRASRLVGAYEEAWDLLRAEIGRHAAQRHAGDRAVALGRHRADAGTRRARPAAAARGAGGGRWAITGIMETTRRTRLTEADSALWVAFASRIRPLNGRGLPPLATDPEPLPNWRRDRGQWPLRASCMLHWRRWRSARNRAAWTARRGTVSAPGNCRPDGCSTSTAIRRSAHSICWYRSSARRAWRGCAASRS